MNVCDAVSLAADSRMPSGAPWRRDLMPKKWASGCMFLKNGSFIRDNVPACSPQYYGSFKSKPQQWFYVGMQALERTVSQGQVIPRRGQHAAWQGHDQEMLTLQFSYHRPCGLRNSVLRVAVFPGGGQQLRKRTDEGSLKSFYFLDTCCTPSHLQIMPLTLRAHLPWWQALSIWETKARDVTWPAQAPAASQWQDWGL